jgi:hypothetical protein
VTIDVLHNDDLRGANPSNVKLSVVGQPSVGTVMVLPADGTKHMYPRLQYKQGKDKLEPGSEVEAYYTVSVPGHPTPAPATVMLLGSGELSSLNPGRRFRLPHQDVCAAWKAARCAHNLCRCTNGAGMSGCRQTQCVAVCQCCMLYHCHTVGTWRSVSGHTRSSPLPNTGCLHFGVISFSLCINVYCSIPF